MSPASNRNITLLMLLLVGGSAPASAWAGSVQRTVSGAAAARVQQSIAGQVRHLGVGSRTAMPQRVPTTSAPPPCRAIAVKCAGLRREASAERILADRYPSERIQSETYLLNRNGRNAIDPKTQTARRIDYVMFSGDKVSRRFEVTSQRADKTAQLAKERRILTTRQNGTPRRGPLYVRDRQSGRLTPVSPVPSEVIRFH